ncbi:MAG: glycerophosphodiester phosphodiesterase family protein [Hyphomicrobiales bacterium]
MRFKAGARPLKAGLHGEPDLSWLIARPITHRGLHDRRQGVVENSASAFARSIEAGYAIECDLQVTAEGEAVVFHDDTLVRMTGAEGRVADKTVAELQRLPLLGGADHMQTLPELLAQVKGRVPLVIELKSRFDGDMRLVSRAAELVAAFDGQASLMSFDPAVVTWLARNAPAIPRGIVADRMMDEEWRPLPVARRLAMRHLDHLPQSRPHFLSYEAAGLPCGIARAFRHAGRPVICWTIRSEQQAMRARRYCDQITFEGFIPA